MMFEKNSDLKYTKIGNVQEDFYTYEWLLVTNLNENILDEELAEYKEYFEEEHCYNNGLYFCNSVTMFRKGDSEDQLIVIVNHGMDV